MKSVHFIGCGAANLFAILYLLENGYDGKIIVIDRGNPPSERKGGKAGLLYGFAGAGLKSDGKLVFSPHRDRTVTVDDDKFRAHSFIKDMVMKFGSDLNININEPVYNSDIEPLLINGLELLQSTVYHLGTANNRVVADRMYQYLIKKGVNFRWGYTVTDIDMNERSIRVEKSGAKGVVTYENLQIGMGKAATEFFKVFAEKHSIDMEHGAVNIGGRFEMLYNKDVEHVANDIQYDFKFFRKYSENESVRTFCTNNASAYVIKESIMTDEKPVMSFNGHAYGLNHEKHNGLTNFAILVRIDGEDAQRYHNTLLNKFDEKGAYALGDAFSSELNPSFDLKKMRELKWIDLIAIYGRPMTYIIDFIERINGILKHNDNYVFYVPEVKMSAGIVATNKHYQLASGDYHEVSFVGDLCTGAVGIVPSAVTGIMGIKRLL